MKMIQIRIHLIDGSGSMAKQERNIKASATSFGLKEADSKTSHLTGLVSVAGKEKPDRSLSLREQTFINPLYEQMVLERLGNKNGQVFFNQ